MYEQVVPNSDLTRVNGISDSDFRFRFPKQVIRVKGFGTNPSQGFGTNPSQG
jgi:hypothetical protein